MIHIYHKGFSAADKQGILKILSFVQITAEECLFIDSTIEDIDIKGRADGTKLEAFEFATWNTLTNQVD